MKPAWGLVVGVLRLLRVRAERMRERTQRAQRDTGVNAKDAKVTQKAQKGIPKICLGKPVKLEKPARFAKAGKAKKPRTSPHAGYRRKIA